MSERDELEAYFRAQTNIRLAAIENKLDKLIGFRWMLIGSSLAVSAIVSVVIGIATVVYGR